LDFLRHERVNHVQDQKRQAARTELVGEPEGAQRAHQAVIEPALKDQAHLFASWKYLVQPPLDDELARRRQAYLGLELLLAEGGRRMR
jgi:hypothetical protein